MNYYYLVPCEFQFGLFQLIDLQKWSYSCSIGCKHGCLWQTSANRTINNIFKANILRSIFYALLVQICFVSHDHVHIRGESDILQLLQIKVNDACANQEHSILFLNIVTMAFCFVVFVVLDTHTNVRAGNKLWAASTTILMWMKLWIYDKAV